MFLRVLQFKDLQSEVCSYFHFCLADFRSFNIFVDVYMLLPGVTDRISFVNNSNNRSVVSF